MGSNNAKNRFYTVYKAGISYFGGWEAAIKYASLDYDKIRKDPKLESYRGMILEKILERIFRALDTKVQVKKRFTFEDEVCIPDFVDNSGTWIDAKLSNWSGGIEGTANKYLRYVDKIHIYFLIDRGHRSWFESKVVFKCVKDFYPALNGEGRDDIVKELTLLEKGIIPSKYQKELDEYLEVEEIEENL